MLCAEEPCTLSQPRPAAHLVSCLDVKDFGAETLRIGDLNGDGAPDLLFVQSHLRTRAITCLTAPTITGTVLWQTGTPSADNGRIYSDLPVQIYDWDNDGQNEVLYVRQAVYAEPPYDGHSVRERATRYEGQATLVVLDGATGQEKGDLGAARPGRRLLPVRRPDGPRTPRGPGGQGPLLEHVGRRPRREGAVALERLDRAIFRRSPTWTATDGTRCLSASP